MKRILKNTLIVILTLVLCTIVRTPIGINAKSGNGNSKLLSELRFRCIGPSVTGGRVHDVEALPDDASMIYIATASGGIWKSTNRGTTWKPIFDHMEISTFGDLAIAPSNPDIIWAGTGEQNNRQSTSWGNGVYLSKDGGETWTHRGLVETRHIGKVLVHPKNPDIAYVAALGNLWKASTERGVFKTTDGGNNWQKVLYVDSLTGIVDMVMDPSKPKILYAAAYQRLRRTWGFNGGGPGSNIYKSTNGGKSWKKLKTGIPEGDKGRIGLAIAKSNPKVLYSIIEHATKGGVYCTRNKGKTWKKVNSLNPRPSYYSHIFVDPVDENRVYVLGVEFYMSENGGKIFRQMPTRPNYDVGIHADFHSMWINPLNPKHFYLVGDAGVHETWDRGETYRHINNIPIAQFYAIGVDMRIPYMIYGGTQDNHSWVGPSATRRWIGIINDDWRQIDFGDGMYQQADPTNYRYVYTNAEEGNLTRFDAKTGDRLNIRPYPPENEKPYRFDWMTPTLLSQHNSTTIYLGGNRLFISRDRGLTWERTEDLTRQIDRNSLLLMGVQGKEKMLSKNDGAASYGEITTIAESPIDPKILWVGTDDGNIQVSKDGGKHWNEVSKYITGVKNGTYVSRIIASIQSYATAYITLDAHRDGDWAPYVFKTTDFGQSWNKLTNGLPEDGSVNVIIEHPDNINLLFLGTEHTLFVSFNAGLEWIKFDSNLPTTLYDDLKIHPRDNDLIVATHGRSLWILDDLTPLVEWSPKVENSPAYLFSIQTATMFHYWKTTSYRSQEAYNGENPPSGAIISYYLNSPTDSVQITIQNQSGDVVRQLSGPGTSNVIHRIHWDLHHESPPQRTTRREREGLVMSKDILPRLPRSTKLQGPFVSPGEYTVILKAGNAISTQTVNVQGDPEMDISAAQWKIREAFLLEIRELQRQIHHYVEKVRKIRDKLEKQYNSLKSVKDSQSNKLELTQKRSENAKAQASRLNRLHRQIYRLAGDINGQGVRQGSLYPPTEMHRMRKNQLANKLKQELKKLKALEGWEDTEM